MNQLTKKELFFLMIIKMKGCGSMHCNSCIIGGERCQAIAEELNQLIKIDGQGSQALAAHILAEEIFKND